MCLRLLLLERQRKERFDLEWWWPKEEWAKERVDESQITSAVFELSFWKCSPSGEVSMAGAVYTCPQNTWIYSVLGVFVSVTCTE